VSVDIFTSDEAIHHVLVEGVAEFDHDVVDRGSEPWVTNESQSKGVGLLVAVSALGEGDELMRSERFQDRGDGFDGNG
jgi:hypothetical protein